MLSATSRGLTYLLSGLYAILGALLFFLPEQMAPVFAWKVTGFMTMTIGGWCLGNAWLAFSAARRWEWGLVYPVLLYLWSFGILETLIVILFRANLKLAHPIAWLYLLTLAVNVFAVIAGILDWLHLRPATPSSERMTGFMRLNAIVFVTFVGLLGTYALFGRIGNLVNNAQVFPEPMSAFTLRAFGAFYLSLMIGMFPMIWEKNRAPFLSLVYCSLGLIVIILAAAFVYLPLFDFNARPGGLLYLGAYLLAGFLSAFFMWKYGSGYAKEHTQTAVLSPRS